MLNALRLRLTLLYTSFALVLMALVGGGGYYIVAQYFGAITDLALQHKMTHELHILGVPIPLELAPADRDWSILREEFLPPGRQAEQRGLLTPVQVAAIAQDFSPGETVHEIELEDDGGSLRYKIKFSDEHELLIDPYSGRVVNFDPTMMGQNGGGSASPVGTDMGRIPNDGAFDAELATIFVLPLDANGQVLVKLDPGATPLPPDRAALSTALTSGSDVRTVTTSTGDRVRLLTYRVEQGGLAALQLGRVLSDQEQLLWQLLMGLLVLGLVGGSLLSVGSWLLAGRALTPAHLAWERQQSFISNASHELRTPLTLMQASTEVAVRTLLPEQVDTRELLHDALAESSHMRRLIDELLTLSRLDSGQLALELQAVNLPMLLGELHRQFGRLADEQGVHFVLGHTAGTAHADPKHLRQVLLVLLDNALRHTPTGGKISLYTSVQGRALAVHVADTGKGIDPEHLPFVFERFYRADAARGAGSGNLGLGLSIAAGLCTAMGGRITAASTPGQGTSITVTLRAA